MEDSMSTSASTLRPSAPMTRDASPSEPSSPRSSSPSSDSVSSLPSVSSSFFFSSAAASPPHPHSESEHDHLATRALVIPSLALPPALRKPTPYGQTLGDLRLLVLGSHDACDRFVHQLLLEDNAEVVEVGGWEDGTIRASTDWVEHRDAHGLETFEPARNVEIVQLPKGQLEDLLRIIHAPFYAVSSVLDPGHRPSGVLAGLVSSPYTPLYTALVALGPLDHLLIDALAPQIPIFTFPPTHSSSSSFRPPSISALRTGLFRSPESLSLLRSEATDRFLRWREVERTVDAIHTSQSQQTTSHHHPWSKAKWEAEWLPRLSQDVAARLHDVPHKHHVRFDLDCTTRYDPLYLPSFVAVSLSLLAPLRTRIRRALAGLADAVRDTRVRLAVLGGFSLGLGVGVFLTSRA